MAGKHCFHVWLEELGKYFLSLDDTEKNVTIMEIIKLSGPAQLQLLSSKLELLVRRDFFKYLPPELSFHVIKWLDYETLCRCCLVSKMWNNVISSCNKAWLNACDEIGVAEVMEDDEKEFTNWKIKYVSAIHRLKRLNEKKTFATRRLFGHTARVFALHYKDGYLASGSDDRTVRMWDLSSGHCKYLLSCHTCADLKFNSKKVLTASFDNTLGLWDWSSGNCLVKFQGHVGAVFCVDYNEDLDLVVSGSSDCTVKFWKMSTGSCLITRLGHQDWVTSVLLQKVDTDCQGAVKGDYIVISMDKTNIKIWSTNISKSHCIVTLPHGEQLAGLLRPRLLCNGKEIMCSSDKGIYVWNLATFQLTRLLTSFPNFWLAAFGEIFSILLNVDSLFILNNKTECCIARIPLSRMRKSLRGSNFLAGDLSWLDDCSEDFECGVVFATSDLDNNICVVEWNEAVPIKVS